MAAKKAPAKKPAAKAAAPAAKKPTAIKDRYNKTQLIGELADKTGLTKAQVGDVINELGVVIERHITPRGAGEFLMPGLFKIKRIKKPAKKAQKNVPNPFKPGEFMDVAAKPASMAVKVQPLKSLKDMAS